MKQKLRVKENKLEELKKNQEDELKQKEDAENKKQDALTKKRKLQVPKLKEAIRKELKGLTEENGINDYVKFSVNDFINGTLSFDNVMVEIAKVANDI